MKHARSALVFGACGACAWIAACGLSSAGTGEATLALEDGSTIVKPNADGSTLTTDGNFSVDSAGSDGESESGDETLDSGVDATPIDPYTTRVSSNLIALYEFEENTGTTINDKIATAYNLTIPTAGDVTWQPHYLSVINYTTLTNPNTFDKFATAAAGNQFTVETWVKFNGVDSSSGGSNAFGRLVSIATSDDTRDVDLGDQLKGGSGGADGYMGVIGNDDSAESGNVSENLVHLVLVANDKDLKIYVNGALIAEITDSDTPKDDATKVPLFLANDKSGDRGVKCDLHLLAFYSVALAPTDVMKNYMAGPDPGIANDN